MPPPTGASLGAYDVSTFSWSECQFVLFPSDYEDGKNLKNKDLLVQPPVSTEPRRQWTLVCCYLSFGDFYIHSAVIRGIVSLEAMVVVEENVCIRLVVAAENICLEIP